MLRQHTYQALLAAAAQVTLTSTPDPTILDNAGAVILDNAGQAILDNGTVPAGQAGTGIAVCGPTGTGSTWVPTQVGVSTSSAVSVPTAQLFIGPMLPAAALAVLMGTQQVTQVAGTATGNSDSIGLTGIQVPQGQALIVQWQGGDPAAVAVMTVAGWQQVTYWR